MAAIGAALMGQVLGHSEAEKAFRPWWDSLEDYLIYSLVMLAVVLVPTAIIIGTPLDCNFCQRDHCGTFLNGTEVRNNEEDPKFNAWWVKKFCTLNGSIEDFMLYFPFFLLLIALALLMIEKVFLKAFKAGSKLDKFYSLLVKENVLQVKKDSGDTVEVMHDVLDGGRETIELRQSFKGTQTYFLCYLLRTLAEIIAALILLVYMLWRGLPVLEHSNTVICNVHSFFFECSGQPAQFYIYSLYITIAITSLYICCNVYNLLWLVFPSIGKLSRVMSTYKQKMLDREENQGKSEREVLGEMYDIYYGNRDLRLLLDLLATSSGVAPAIGIMTLFDKGFRDAMKPKIEYVSVSRELGIAEVGFQVPKSGVRKALDDIHGVHLMYIAEISPPAATAVEPFETKFIPEDSEESKAADVEMSPLTGGKKITGYVLRAEFQGLKNDIKYTIKVSTVVNGKTICQAVEEIEDKHERLPPVENCQTVNDTSGGDTLLCQN